MWPPFIDVHVHLPPDQPDEMLLFDAMLDQMIGLGLQKIIVVNTLHGEPNRWAPSFDQLLAGWERLRAWTARDAARRFGMAFISARALAGRPVRDVCRHFVDAGAVGFKVTLNSKEGGAIYPEVFAIAEQAADLHVPVLFHCYLRPCEMRPGELTPADVASVAARVPDAAIIAAHAGADYQRGLPMLADVANVYVDISGTRCYEGMAAAIVRWMGPRRVLYGSDLYGRGPWSQLAKLDSAGLAPEVCRDILFNNAEHLFWGGRNGVN